MPEDILTPITKVLLRENDNLALIFPVRGGKYALYFFRVMRRYFLNRVFPNLGTLSGGSSQDFTYIGESGLGSGDDAIYVWEEYPFRIYHFAFGISPDYIWFYKAQPAGYPQTAFGYKVPPKVGDYFDFIPAELSPYDEPTVATETVVYYKMSVHVGFYNPTDKTATLAVRILGAGYDVVQITDENFIKKMIAGIKPVRYITVGGLRYFEYQIPEDWRPPTIVDSDTIAKIMAEVR